MTVFLISCTPRDETPAKAEASASKVTVNNDLKDEGQKSENRSASSSSVLSEISDPEGRDFLLYNEKLEERVFPEDFEIGLLQNYLEIDLQLEKILSLTDKFLSSIINGSPDYDFVSEERIDFVKRNLSYELEISSPTGYRLGQVNVLAEPPRAAVRFEGKEGYAEGEIYFIMNNNWKIFDLHVSFSDLNKINKSSELWYPSDEPN